MELRGEAMLLFMAFSGIYWSGRLRRGLVDALFVLGRGTAGVWDSGYQQRYFLLVQLCLLLGMGVEGRPLEDVGHYLPPGMTYSHLVLSGLIFVLALLLPFFVLP